MLTVITPERGTDDFGSGAFGASRGTRKHKGVDFHCVPNSVLLSPVDGTVTKIGYPYADATQFRYVEVTDILDNRHRFFYCLPYYTISISDEVFKGDKLAVSQNISEHYTTDKKYMKNHIHYEILDRSNTPVDPNEYIYEI